VTHRLSDEHSFGCTIMRSSFVSHLSSQSENHASSSSSFPPPSASSLPLYYLPNVIPIEPISLQQFGLVHERFDSSSSSPHEFYHRLIPANGQQISAPTLNSVRKEAIKLEKALLSQHVSPSSMISAK
jgi:hypothetical protein